MAQGKGHVHLNAGEKESQGDPPALALRLASGSQASNEKPRCRSGS